MRFLRALLRPALVALLLCGGALPPSEVSAQAALGPAPRDADGLFVNPVGPLSHGGVGVRLSFVLRRLGRSLRSDGWAPTRVPNDGAFLRENARHSTPTVTWIGHATLLVQMDHLSFLTDPIWSERASPFSFVGPARRVAPGVALDDLPPIDFVVVSHDHYDHLDLRSLEALARRNAETRFFVPLGNGDLLRDRGIGNVVELDWGESLAHEGVRVHCVPTQHWSLRGLGGRNRALWSGWAVSGPERRFYFAGDTGYFEGFARIGAALGPFDLAAVPIGAYLPREMMREAHMNPAEAAQAAVDLRAARAVGMHFGTFELSDEPPDEPPRLFREAATQGALGAPAAWILDIGETRAF